MAVDDGNHLKAVHEMELADGTLAQNVFYFECDFDAQQTNYDTLVAIAGYIYDIYNAVAAFLDTNATLNYTEVDKIAWNATEGKWLTTGTLGQCDPAFTATGSGDTFPNQIAPVLRANTSRPKSFGRKFLMAFVESAATGTDLTSAALTALAIALAHYLADETVSGTSKLVPGVPRADENTFLPFTDGVVNSLVGTQRRRKPGVGR